MGLKTYLLNRIDSRRFRLNGIIPSTRLPSKQKLCQTFRDHVCYSPAQLPHKVDLRSDMTPVEDQSKIGSCAANCLAGAYEYLTKKSDGRNTDVSRLFIYYNARAADHRGGRLTDSGCTMTSAIEALEEFGTCLESIWPYNITDVNARPSDQAFQEAKNHKITDALQIGIDLNEMKTCLAQGFPFAFGLRLFRSFDKASHTGVVPMPNATEQGRSSHGSHAMLAVGYSDHSRSFIVRNSWGADWGEKGYCYIPYDYMTNSNLCFDAWAIRKLENDKFGKEHWDNTDAINYMRNVAIELLSMDKNEGNDDSTRAIESVIEDDEPNSGYPNDRWPNDSGWPGQNHMRDHNRPSWYQQPDAHNAYPRHDMPPYYDQQPQFDARDNGYSNPPYEPWRDNGNYHPYGNGLQPNNFNYPNPSYPPTLADIMNASANANQSQGPSPYFNNPPYNYPYPYGQ